MNRIFLLAVLFFLSGTLYAQSSKDSMAGDNIKVVSRYRNGAVELRWYPTQVGSWRKSIQLGYSIKRMELSDAGSTEGFKELAMVKPYTPEEWKQRTNIKDDLVKAAMESMAPSIIEKGQSAWEMQNDENAMFFAYCLSTSFSAEAAKGAGLVYTDNSIVPGKKYVYAVSINQGKGKLDEKDEALAFVTETQNNYNAPSPQDLVFEEGEGFVKLKWNNTTNQDNFVGYDIERSSDAGRTFSKLNKTPFISVAESVNELQYTDSVKNYTPHQYRIVGITPWADRSNPSIVVTAIGRDKTPASPPLNTRAKGDRSKILVTWDLPVQSKDLKGFVVARSNKLEGPFTAISDRDKIVAVSQRMFVDTKPSPMEPYYAVYAVDTANNISSTFSVMASIYDSVGPARPTGVTGRIDSNGVVNISWKFGKDNDLVGYNVYVANGIDNVYRQLTGSPLIDSVFTDTVSMRSLTKDVYYKITAVDYNNNASAYSEIAVLKRPDVIAPAAPVIKSYAVGNNKISFEFIGSSSDDVVNYHLMRRDETGKEIKLAEMRTVSSFTDSTVKEGASYSYILIAIDGSNLNSASKTLNISMTEQEIKEGVRSLAARVNAQEKQVVLTWSPINNTASSMLVLFRSLNGEEMNVYKRITTDKQAYTENGEAGKYQYAMKVLYSNGAESELSEIVSVEIKN
ncbi:MAG: hypothetical protein ABIN74_09680 [Ferruginibacter sp.]